MDKNLPAAKKREHGFSLIELLAVMTVLVIMTALAMFYMMTQKTLYKPDDQVLQIVDILQEARQRALTQRRPLRVEIDLTDNMVRLIDENQLAGGLPPTPDDDILLRQLRLFTPGEVKIESRPNNISTAPPETFPAPSAVFGISEYPKSATHKVCTLRFLSNGTVTNAGTGPVGNNSVITGLTLYNWSPTKTDPDTSLIARAITVSGMSGLVKLWEYNPSSTQANKWQDSRRGGS